MTLHFIPSFIAQIRSYGNEGLNALEITDRRVDQQADVSNLAINSENKQPL